MIQSSYIKKNQIISILLTLVVFTIFLSFSNKQTSIPWQEIDKGLLYVSLDLPIKSSHADSKIDVLKINPKNYSFKLICAEQKKSHSKTAKLWAQENNLLACVNAGMFKLEGDFKTSMGFLKNGNYINNKTLNPSYKNVFAFNKKDSTLPSAKIIDMTCDDWKNSKEKYTSFSQCIRMVDCNGKNTWQKDKKKWSMVLMGEDLDGHILFIFVRSPYTVSEYVDMLLKAPLRLKRLMYLEGGPEASFLVNHKNLQLEKFGSYETDFYLSDDNNRFWDIPNVIGILKK